MAPGTTFWPWVYISIIDIGISTNIIYNYTEELIKISMY